MINHASQTPTIEVCGLVSTRQVYRMKNVALHPENHFAFDSVQFIKLFYQILNSTEETLLGMYHSHPNGSPHPSLTDIQQANYPQWVYFIVYGTQVSAWRILDGETTLLNLHIIR